MLTVSHSENSSEASRRKMWITRWCSPVLFNHSCNSWNWTMINLCWRTRQKSTTYFNSTTIRASIKSSDRSTPLQNLRAFKERDHQTVMRSTRQKAWVSTVVVWREAKTWCKHMNNWSNRRKQTKRWGSWQQSMRSLSIRVRNCLIASGRFHFYWASSWQIWWTSQLKSILTLEAKSGMPVTRTNYWLSTTRMNGRTNSLILIRAYKPSNKNSHKSVRSCSLTISSL